MAFSRNHGIAFAVIGGALTLALAGCGAGEQAASAGAAVDEERLAELDGLLAAASEQPEFLFDGEPFDMSAIAGKTIYNIPNSSAIPYIQVVDEEAAAIAEEYGATWVEYENQGTPTEHAAGIEQAVNEGADLIILAQGVNAELLLPGLERAEAAGIPVLSTHTYQTGYELPAELEGLIDAVITAPFNEAAAMMAQYAIRDTGGEGDFLLITSSEVPPSNGMIESMRAQFTEYCPDTCSVSEIDIATTDWATEIASSVQSELQSNPGIDYVLPVYDSMMLYVESGVTASGMVGQVKTASFNGTPEILRLMQEGDVVVMDVGEDVRWLAWSTMDEAGRLLTGAPLTEDFNQHTPLMIIDDDNVDDTGTPPAAGEGYGGAYVDGYRALWGAP
jgi:ribose transport system substrate-binding protein